MEDSVFICSHKHGAAAGMFINLVFLQKKKKNFFRSNSAILVIQSDNLFCKHIKVFYRNLINVLVEIHSDYDLSGSV